jgi:hypothetical protein
MDFFTKIQSMVFPFKEGKKKVTKKVVWVIKANPNYIEEIVF